MRIMAGIFNVMELPATCIPMGLSHEGLPLGVQLVGPFQRDDVPLSLALVCKELLPYRHAVVAYLHYNQM